MSLLEILVPAVIVVLISLPLVAVFEGKATKKAAKMRLASHVALFFGLVGGCFLYTMGSASAAEGTSEVASIPCSTNNSAAAIPLNPVPATSTFFPFVSITDSSCFFYTFFRRKYPMDHNPIYATRQSSVVTMENTATTRVSDQPPSSKW